MPGAPACSLKQHRPDSVIAASRSHALLLPAAAAAAAAAAESSPLLLATPLPAPPNPCAPVLDFFPTAAEIDAPPRATARTSFLRNGTAVEVPCPAGEDCGFPAVWQAAAQDASLALVPGAYGLQTRGPLKVRGSAGLHARIRGWRVLGGVMSRSFADGACTCLLLLCGRWRSRSTALASTRACSLCPAARCSCAAPASMPARRPRRRESSRLRQQLLPPAAARSSASSRAS